MNGYIKMFKGLSNSGRPMFSSINRKMTAIGAVIQGTAQGTKQALPYFIMITEVEPDTLPDVMYYNPQSNDLLDESGFLSLGRGTDDSTGDSVTESSELPA